jgi:hypothetical protein
MEVYCNRNTYIDMKKKIKKQKAHKIRMRRMKKTAEDGAVDGAVDVNTYVEKRMQKGENKPLK